MARGGDGRPQPPLHDPHRGLQRRVPRVRDVPPADQLPEQDAVREDVALVRVVLVRDHLGRHPAVRPRLRRHLRPVRALNARDAEVRHFHHLVLVHQQVRGF